MGGLVVVVMRRFLFSVAFAWLAAVAGFAQQTTFQRVFDNAFVPGTSPPLRNIGQATHIVLLIASAAPGTGTACATSAPISMHLEFSFDGIFWVPFGAPDSFPLLGTLPLPQTFVLTAAGVFPQFRLNLVSFNQSNCRITAWYSGSQIGSAPLSFPAAATVPLISGSVSPSSKNGKK
jgi:hypothetical protein